MTPAAFDWDRFFAVLAEAVGGDPVPSVTLIAEKHDPYRVLASTIISLRTKDAVTLAASARLFKAAPDLAALATLDEESIAELIYPAGFYRVKAGQLKKIAERLKETGVPGTREALLELPGVGRKTANLVLGLAFAVQAICVDIHVHRISNRLGFIATNHPEESETELEKILPGRYWIPVNTLMVAFGQRVCTPVSPRCSLCPFGAWCPRKGVSSSR